MANAITALNPYIWTSVVQDFLNASLVATEICNTKCEAYLTSGSRVNFPYMADVRVQDYTQGTDLTVDALAATQDYLDVDQSKVVTFAMDPVQEKQALANYGVDMARQASFQLRNNIDQKVLYTGTAAAASTVAGGTLTTSTLISKMSDVYSTLARKNAVDGDLFGVIDPETASLLSQTFIANGFNIADNTLRNGFAGMAVGFNVYVSNNLQNSVTLTVDTQPTNLDTFTILGYTWTCVTDGTAATAGQVNIGGNLADFKLIFVTAINGTTPPSANDYIDIATAGRRVYQNAQLTAATFNANDCVLTAYGKMSCTETFFTGTNVFGIETTNMLFGRKGAVSLAIQMQHELTIAQEPRQLAKNWHTHTLFGCKTFTRDAQRLVKMSRNVV
jgi:hypothetical protein